MRIAWAEVVVVARARRRRGESCFESLMLVDAYDRGSAYDDRVSLMIALGAAMVDARIG